jgi:glycogen debranching enzyme
MLDASQQELARLHSPDGSYDYASGDDRFRGASFGRDTLCSLRSYLTRLQLGDAAALAEVGMVTNLVVGLARNQGTREDQVSEELPGVICHEFRVPGMGDQEIFNRLKEIWSSDKNPDAPLRYYGTVDATPLFVSVALGLQSSGTDVLSVPFVSKDGQRCKVLDAVTAALGHVLREVDVSDIHLLESRPINPLGLKTKSMKDSVAAYFRLGRDGRPVPVNFALPVAPVETQGLLYDALGAAARNDQLLEQLGISQADIHARMDQLAHNFLGRFALPAGTIRDQPYPYFAHAIDRDEQGRPHAVDILTANVGHLLDTELLQRPEFAPYIEGIVRTLFSQEFLCDGGIRSHALRYIDTLPFTGQQSSATVWAVETNIIARGLYRLGFPGLARELWTRMLCDIAANGCFSEFSYYDRDGRLLIPENRADEQLPLVKLLGEKNPELTQYWTIEAALEADTLLRSPNFLADSPATDYTRRLEDSLLASLDETYAGQPQALIDRITGNMRRYALTVVEQGRNFEVSLPELLELGKQALAGAGVSPQRP